MNASAVISAAHEMLIVTFLLATPFLLAATLTSLVIGLLQAATRINDLTLSFIPRFLAVLLVIYCFAAWAAGQMISYIERSALAMRALLG